MNHLSNDMILRTLDHELTLAERVECEAHLMLCEECRRDFTAAEQLSVEIETAVNTTSVPLMSDMRQRVQKTIEEQSKPAAALQHPTNVMRRFGWGMGIAATLAFGILLMPKHDTDLPIGADSGPGVIEVDGERFVPVPFSNSDLSTFSPHIVQMQVPVSSLADVGIVVEPITNSLGAATERTVLADVLVGADGQPRGVHVLGSE